MFLNHLKDVVTKLEIELNFVEADLDKAMRASQGCVRVMILVEPRNSCSLRLYVSYTSRGAVKVKEWTLAEKEVPLNTETEDRVIFPSAQTISLVDHTIHDELNINSGKRKKRVAFVSWSPPMKKARAKAPTSVNAPVAESVSDGRRSSGSGPEAGALSATPSQGSSTDDFYESQTIDFAFALNKYIDSAAIIQQRDTKIADLKARLEKSEAVKDDQGNKDAAPEFARFQPSIDQVVVPVYYESGFVDCEMLLYNVIPTIR
nr:hypothetical protein [Tanacetum cinerariifolium]